MNRAKYVFSQIIEFLDNDKFRKIVDKYDGDRYVKHFTCWNQLLVMMFGQLCNRTSLMYIIIENRAREIIEKGATLECANIAKIISFPSRLSAFLSLLGGMIRRSCLPLLIYG